MQILFLAFRNLGRRPLRSLLTLAGIGGSIALLATLLSMGEGYERGLHSELDRMGMQMMLVPLGCPFDAAARVLKGRSLEVTLPESALETARKDPAVAIAAPVFTAVLPRRDEGRTDLWMGIDESSRPLRPWWKFTPGSRWFTGPDTVILGAEAAETEMRKPGDRFYSPEARKELTVAGILERSGTSDDSLFFVPLRTAQAMFNQPGRLTAVSIRLTDPERITEAFDRLQKTPGAQVVTLTEMMGTFLNLVGGARTLVLAIALVGVAVSLLSVFNTMMAAVLERVRELGVLRSIGVSRGRVFLLMTAEAVALSIIGGVIGLALAAVVGPFLERWVRGFVPLAPEGGLPTLTATTSLSCIAIALAAGLAAGMYPAWQASRLQPVEALRME
jgi:ABC-type transport system, involved in lipoprotein release, permease component